jgi:hypothetical protein
MAQLASSVDYGNGRPAVRIAPDGSGRVHYNLPGSPVAVFVQTVDPPQSAGAGVESSRYVFLYDRPREDLVPPRLPSAPASGGGAGGAEHNAVSRKQMAEAAAVRFRSKHLLASFDDRSVGYALERPDARPCLVPGVRCANFRVTANSLSRCFECGHEVTAHLVGRKLMLTAEGGNLTDERGNTTNRWLWDAKRQGAGVAPQLVTLNCNGNLTLTLAGRHDLVIRFESGADGVRHEFHCGLRHERPSYDAGAPRSLLSRGKLEPRLPNRPALAERTDEIVAASHDRRERLESAMEAREGLAGFSKAHRDAHDVMRQRIRAHQLGESMTATLDLSTGGERMRREAARSAGGPGFGITGSGSLGQGLEWTGSPRHTGLAATVREVPLFLRKITGLGGAGGDDTAAAPESARLDLSATLASMRSTVGSLLERSLPHSRRGAHATPHDVAQAMMMATTGRVVAQDGLGSLAGAAMHNGKWIHGADVLRKLQSHHPFHGKNGPLLRASGKFDAWRPIVRDHDDIAFRALDRITHEGLQAFLKTEARPDQAVLVCFAHPSDGPCRAVMQTLEHVNGTLAAGFPNDPQFARLDVAFTPAATASAAAEISSSPGKASPSKADASPTKGGASPAKGGAKAAPPAANQRSEMCPFRLACYDMSAASPSVVHKYGVKTLPFFVVFYGAKPVYGGVMGGPRVVGIPLNSRGVNVLVADPHATTQLQAETLLRAAGMKYDIASGVFSAEAGKVVGTCAAAARAVADNQRRALQTRQRQRQMRSELDQDASNVAGGSGGGDGGGGGGGGSGGGGSGARALAGTDATAQVTADYSLVLLDAGCFDAIAEVEQLAQAIGASSHAQSASSSGAGGSSGSGGGVRVGSVALRLVGRSLLAACWPLDAAPTGAGPCATCVGLSHTRRDERARADAATPWSCPHCGIVQNASPELLLGGRASAAIVKPLRAGALDALGALYRRLLVEAAGGAASSGLQDLASLLRRAGADPAEARCAAAIRRAPIVGRTIAEKGGVASDDVHLGLSHNDVLDRLLVALDMGRSGDVKPEGWRPTLGVSASETIIRGVPLTR